MSWPMNSDKNTLHRFIQVVNAEFERDILIGGRGLKSCVRGPRAELTLIVRTIRILERVRSLLNTAAFTGLSQIASLQSEAGL